MKRKSLSAALNGPGPTPKAKPTPRPAEASSTKPKPKVPAAVQEQIDKQDPSLGSYPMKRKVESKTMPNRYTMQTVMIPKGVRPKSTPISEETAKKYRQKTPD